MKLTEKQLNLLARDFIDETLKPFEPSGVEMYMTAEGALKFRGKDGKLYGVTELLTQFGTEVIAYAKE